MLRLKQIDIYGFKSFCNRERLRFSGRGIAAVVGPNGCGKSNICDAINWVLGEQSAKSLRGSRMHDVIFNGTSSRKPSGMATVTLALQDPDGALAEWDGGAGRPRPVEIPPSKTPGEILVTRKLFRTGESQYILNGKVVRLRDVQDLFLGTGLGPNHYAIIEQGRIGNLLGARPVDRRVFIEEAAGVTRFKARRKLAELKLVNAELNLERVHDILQEIQRQADSLKRQANRAERYERYREQLREAQRLLFASRFRYIESERVRLDAEALAAQERLREASAETERMETDFSRKREFEQRWETQLETEREELSALRIDQERMRERVEQQARAAAGNAARADQAVQDLKAIRGRLQALEAGVERDRREAGSIAEAAGALQGRLDAKEAECAAQDQAAADLRADHEACRNRLLETLNAIAHRRAELGKLEETLAAHERQLEAVRARGAEASERRAQAAERERELTLRADALRLQRAEQAARCASLRDALGERRSQLEAASKEAVGERAEVSSLAARRDSLRELLAHRAYTTATVKDIFDAIENEPQAGFRPLGVLADFLEVEGGHEKVVEQFLGEELEFVVVGGWDEADRGVQLVRKEFEGRAAFFVLSGPGAEPGPAKSAPERDAAQPLANHVRLTLDEEGPLASALPKLRDAYLVKDAAAAQRLAGFHPELWFLLPDGTWYRGNTVQVGRKTSSGPLVLKQQLRDLTPRLQDAERRLASLERDIANADEAVRREAAELDAAREDLQDLEKQAVALDHDLRECRQRAGDLEQAGRDADLESDRLEAERARCANQREEALADRARLDEAYAAAEVRASQLSDQAVAAQALAAGLQEERTALRTQAAALGERQRASEASLRRAETQFAEHSERAAEAERQIERWRLEGQRFLQDNEELEERIAKGAARQEELRLRVRETGRSLQESRAQTGALVEAIRDRRALVETERRECSSKEVELARVQADLDHLAADCKAEVGQPIAEIASAAPDELTPEDLEEAEERHRSVQEKIARLGPVNVLAKEEYEQVSQRLQFLETQQQDLIDSIRNTREAIREIDSASRERFDAAFESINRNFREVFATLFGGGVGEMRLTDPENLEESGIDIVAQPPGKRLQNVALLSGGEKSLTVMALLMATFRHQPSPFCLLDEVDSQLDEANTVRFRRLLQEMAPETQFMVITHSKTTMEAAETLYGVTMSEAGVSKLVSVRMEEHRATAEADAEPVLALSA